jgi:hypothetical protein
MNHLTQAMLCRHPIISQPQITACRLEQEAKPVPKIHLHRLFAAVEDSPIACRQRQS